VTTPTATHGRRPNSLAVAHLNQFTDATPLKEGCDPFTCTERVGGEHSDQCEVSQRRCYLCRRDVSDGLFVNVDFGLHVEHVCETCWSRGAEGIEMPLDMTEDVWDA
jgi:hypothetical protein